MKGDQQHKQPRHHGWRITSQVLYSIPPELLNSIMKLILAGLDVGVLDVPQNHQRMIKEWVDDMIQAHRQNDETVKQSFFKQVDGELFPFFDQEDE